MERLVVNEFSPSVNGKQIDDYDHCLLSVLSFISLLEHRLSFVSSVSCQF